MRRVVSWIRGNPWRQLSFALVSAFVLLNIVAYRHARAMTHFVPSGSSLPSLGKLSTLEKFGILFSGVKFPHPNSPATPETRGLLSSVHHFPGHFGQPEAWFIPREHAKGIVLLFHGYGECKAHLLPEAEAFLGMNYACFLVDFPGYGGSEGDTTTLGYREAEDVDHAVKYVRDQWPGLPVIAFGRSMGSVAILRAMAVEGTTVDAAVLECPFDRMLSTIKARVARMNIPTFPCAQLLVFWGGVQLGIDGFAHNPFEYAREVNCPVLLMNGDTDPYVTVEETNAIYNNLAGKKQLFTFEGLEHQPYLAKRPDLWKLHVQCFLANLWRSDGEPSTSAKSP
jgi:uncharacterized protein